MYRPAEARLPWARLSSTARTTSASQPSPALNVKYRDVRYALPFLVQIWMFASPILYPLSLVKHWRWVLYLNPLTGLIEGFRSSLLGRPMAWPRARPLWRCRGSSAAAAR